MKTPPLFGPCLLSAVLIAGIVSAHDAPSATTHTAAAPASSLPTVQAIPAKHHVAEGEPGWNCATGGNHVCGPRNPEGIKAGCYDNGTLVIPWQNLTTLQRRSISSPCTGQAPTQEAESDTAYAAAQH